MSFDFEIFIFKLENRMREHNFGLFLRSVVAHVVVRALCCDGAYFVTTQSGNFWIHPRINAI